MVCLIIGFILTLGTLCFRDWLSCKFKSSNTCRIKPFQKYFNDHVPYGSLNVSQCLNMYTNMHSDLYCIFLEVLYYRSFTLFFRSWENKYFFLTNEIKQKQTRIISLEPNTPDPNIYKRLMFFPCDLDFSIYDLSPMSCHTFGPVKFHDSRQKQL